MKLSFFLFLFISSSLFANAIATVSVIKGDAIVDRFSKQIVIVNNFKIKEKDIIITRDKSKVQIIFKDDTIISIGENSSFSIENYLFEDNEKPIARFKMSTGIMRTISGKIGKIAPRRFTVKTKTATIGIRGTNFGLILDRDKLYQSFCTSGAIDVRIANKEYLIKEGFFMNISKSGKVKIREFTKNDMIIIKNNDFVINQDFKAIIKNSIISSKIKIGKNIVIKNSNVGNSIKAKTISIKNSKIKSDAKIGNNSHIENSNLGNEFKAKNLKIINSKIKTKVNVGSKVVVQNSNLGTKINGNISSLNTTSNVKIGNNTKIKNSNLGIEIGE